MKRILVCYKIVDDTDELLPYDWADLGTGYPDTSYVRRILGCFDEAAIENALLLKDAYREKGIDTHITGITISPGYSDHIIGNFSAIGIDRTVCIDNETDLRFSQLSTASVLKRFVSENGPFDIIFTGSQTPPGETGMVPFYLAESLGLPCVSAVVSVSLADDGLWVSHTVNAGLCTKKVHVPFVCAIGNSKYAYLRVPTLRDKLKSKSVAPPERYAASERPPTDALKRLHRETTEKQCEFIAGPDAEELAGIVFHRFLRERLP